VTSARLRNLLIAVIFSSLRSGRGKEQSDEEFLKMPY